MAYSTLSVANAFIELAENEGKEIGRGDSKLEVKTFTHFVSPLFPNER